GGLFGESDSDLALDVANVYWASRVAGAVTAYPKAGGPRVTLAADLHQPSAVAVGGGNVYWSYEDPNLEHHYKIARVAAGGGTPTVLVSDLTWSPQQMVYDGGGLFLSGGGGSPRPNALAKLVTCP